MWLEPCWRGPLLQGHKPGPRRQVTRILLPLGEAPGNSSERRAGFPPPAPSAVGLTLLCPGGILAPTHQMPVTPPVGDNQNASRCGHCALCVRQNQPIENDKYAKRPALWGFYLDRKMLLTFLSHLWVSGCHAEPTIGQLHSYFCEFSLYLHSK